MRLEQEVSVNGPLQGTNSGTQTKKVHHYYIGDSLWRFHVWDPLWALGASRYRAPGYLGLVILCWSGKARLVGK